MGPISARPYPSADVTVRPWICSCCSFTNPPGIARCGMCNAFPGEMPRFQDQSAYNGGYLSAPHQQYYHTPPTLAYAWDGRRGRGGGRPRGGSRPESWRHGAEQHAAHHRYAREPVYGAAGSFARPLVHPQDGVTSILQGFQPFDAHLNPQSLTAGLQTSHDTLMGSLSSTNMTAPAVPGVGSSFLQSLRTGVSADQFYQTGPTLPVTTLPPSGGVDAPPAPLPPLPALLPGLQDSLWSTPPLPSNLFSPQSAAPVSGTYHLSQ
jgi:hypothetical protein